MIGIERGYYIQYFDGTDYMPASSLLVEILPIDGLTRVGAQNMRYTMGGAFIHAIDINVLVKTMAEGKLVKLLEEELTAYQYGLL